MPTPARVAQSILDYNQGRDPEMLRRKFAILRSDPYAFYRGTCHLFYETLPRHAALVDAPALLVCGDLHLENFGAYKGDNGLAYFDLNDFDEATVAPFTYDVLRLIASIHVAAHLRLSPQQAEALGAHFVERYRAWILDGKARWLERQTAEGMVRDLLGSVIERTRAQLLKARTTRTDRGRRLRMTDRALPVGARRRAVITAAIERFGVEQRSDRFFRVRDVARRVAGKGSLGLERYVVLVEGEGAPRGHFLLDVKHAVPSTVPGTAATDPWASQAERVVTLQRVAQAIPPALLHTLPIGGRMFVLKELQPMTDKLDLARWDGRLARLQSAVASMAAVTAWAHLRGCYRHGACSLEDLQRYVARPGWQRAMPRLAARCSGRALEQWAAYGTAYDQGDLALDA